MEITRSDLCLHHDFENGLVTFGVYLSPAADCADDELNEAIQKWADGDDVELNFRFSIRDCVEDMIEGNRYWREKEIVMMGDSNKAMVAALRAELVEMITRLDEIQFEPDSPNAELSRAGTASA